MVLDQMQVKFSQNLML